ncbi:hypothetical protein KGM_202309 [Danaus plexippus plexippus]|uniref:Uncharacterized protein n=1 Tax=Danaus plexippus plexippus TaxID=278856 RepID=A0A212F1P2_DANPL|nr:uncharacterized protein LOC116773309 [Danaus plexippus plexippus]OWR47641.1 hypothetical protein KGM_202309 [Danaus plexippus plexippus]
MSRNSRYYTAPVPKMPPGLIELMDGLARDVLKNNPTDIYEFCSDHMKKLLQTRDSLKVKQPKTLEQKIATAKKIINERAVLRREAYDKNTQITKAQTVENINIKKDCVKDTNTENDMKSNVTDLPEQYIKNNVIKIDEVSLSGNKEHEITVSNVESNKHIPLSEEHKDNSAVDIANDDEINVLNKEEIFETVNITGPVSVADQNVSEHIGLNVDSAENVDVSVKAIENNVDIEKSINLDEVNASTTFVVQSSNDETGKNNTEIVEQIVSTEEKNDDDKNNECNKTNTADETEVKEDINSHDTGKDMCKIDQSNEIVDDKQDLISINCESEPINSENQGLDYEIKNNDITSSEVNNDSKNTTEQLETELNHKPSSSKSNENSEENNISDKPLDSANEMNVEATTVIGDNTDEDKELKETFDRETISDHKQHSLINDDKDKNDQKLGNAVNDTTMDLETAAITIQKVFRSFLFRNKTLSSDDATNVDISLLIEDKDQKNDGVILSGNSNKDRRTLGLSRIDSVLQTVNEEQSLSLSTDDSSTLSSAATIIQAHVRGFLVRNKLIGNKANSSTSGFDSDGHSTASLEIDNDGRKNKTVLNIHIVPEGGHFMSRDESMLTSIDLSVDGSPRDSVNLHPMGHDTNERRKLLKREDAIQSISPPSNNSGKQSEEVDSVKEIFEQNTQQINRNDCNGIIDPNKSNASETNEKLPQEKNDEIENVDAHAPSKLGTSEFSLPSLTSDEMDVVTPFTATDSDGESKIMHSGEFHDVLLPTTVSRSDTSVVRGE